MSGSLRGGATVTIQRIVQSAIASPGLFNSLGMHDRTDIDIPQWTCRHDTVTWSSPSYERFRIGERLQL
jgi:hypothetical protein